MLFRFLSFTVLHTSMASRADETQSKSRYLELSEPVQRMLPPIENLDGKPLVALELAMKSLIGVVKNIEPIVSNIKIRCSMPKDGLSVDESAAIMLYTYESEVHEESPYFILNRSLRNGKREEIDAWSLYIKLFISALEKLPNKSGVYYRGVRGDYSGEYPHGIVFTWWTFTLCTSRLDVLENDSFFGNNGIRTLFAVECKTGKDIKNHSWVSNEDDILLVPMIEFRVKPCLALSGGLHILQIDEISSPFSTVSIDTGIRNQLKFTILLNYSTYLAVYCSKHPNKLIEHWCKQDNELICDRCLIEKHMNHDCISAEDFTASKSEEVELHSFIV